MKRLRRVLAMLTVIVIIGMVIAAFIMGIMGNPYTISMIGVTFGISILLYVLLWFMKLLEERNNNGNNKNEK